MVSPCSIASTRSSGATPPTCHRRPGPRGDLVVAEAAGRQHASRGDVPARHGVGVRLLRRLSRPATACFDLNTEGRPGRLFDRLGASGFTHFQQSGTGAIRKYYNYFPGHPDARSARRTRDGVGAA